MTNKKLGKLGWKHSDTWNNREFYKLETKRTSFSIFEHDGFGILDPFDEDLNLIYCDLTDKEIETYTKLARIYDEVTSNPEKYSLAAFNIARQILADFINKMRKRS